MGRDTGQGLRDKTRTCALISHYEPKLLSNTHQSNQVIYLSYEVWAHCVNIRIILNSLFNCKVFVLGIKFLFNTRCVQSDVSEMCVWQPSLEEVSLDYSNHPNVRMNECKGGVYSAAAHFSSTWHKAPALFHPLSLSISVSPSPRTVQTKEAEELQNLHWPARMSSHTNAKSLKVAYSSPKRKFTSFPQPNVVPNLYDPFSSNEHQLWIQKPIAFWIHTISLGLLTPGHFMCFYWSDSYQICWNGSIYTCLHKCVSAKWI